MMKAVDYVGEHGIILERQQCRPAIATAVFASRSIFDINNPIPARGIDRWRLDRARILGRLEAMKYKILIMKWTSESPTPALDCELECSLDDALDFAQDLNVASPKRFKYSVVLFPID
jgi:hypothetical protein